MTRLLVVNGVGLTPRLLEHMPRLAAVAAEGFRAELGTILGIWAHPDDEAYLSGGLMAIAREHGSRVVCVTAQAAI